MLARYQLSAPFGDSAGAQPILARSACSDRHRVSPPFIPVNRTWCVSLAVNQIAAGSNPAAGARHGAVVYWLGFAVLSRKERDRYPPALPKCTRSPPVYES